MALQEELGLVHFVWLVVGRRAALFPVAQYSGQVCWGLILPSQQHSDGGHFDLWGGDQEPHCFVSTTHHFQQHSQAVLSLGARLCAHITQLTSPLTSTSIVGLEIFTAGSAGCNIPGCVVIHTPSSEGETARSSPGLDPSPPPCCPSDLL